MLNLIQRGYWMENELFVTAGEVAQELGGGQTICLQNSTTDG